MKKIFSIILLASLFACSDSDVSKSASTSTAKSEKLDNDFKKSDNATECVTESATDEGKSPSSVVSKVQVEESRTLLLNTDMSTLSWIGWEGPKSNNHNHYGTMNFLDGKIKLSSLKESTIIESGDFTLSLSSIYVEDLKVTKKKNRLKNHLLADDFFNADLFPNIKVRIVSSSFNSNKVEIDILGKKVYANVPIKLTQDEFWIFAKTDAFTVDLSALNIEGFEPNKSDD